MEDIKQSNSLQEKNNNSKYLKITRKIKDKVWNILVWSVQNRVTALWYSCIIARWVAPDVSNIENIYAEVISATVLALSSMVWGWLIWITYSGKDTAKIYKRTLENIELSGELDERFFIKTIWWYKESKYLWYCQIQWIYLAAKKMWKLEQFYQYKEKHTKNLIWNF